MFCIFAKVFGNIKTDFLLIIDWFWGGLSDIWLICESGLAGFWVVCGWFDWFVAVLRVVCGYFGWFVGGSKFYS